MYDEIDPLRSFGQQISFGRLDGVPVGNTHHHLVCHLASDRDDDAAAVNDTAPSSLCALRHSLET
jgi:hypothetical protein